MDIVYEGVLKKRSTKSLLGAHAWYDRYFVIRDSSVSYYKSKQDMEDEKDEVFYTVFDIKQVASLEGNKEKRLKLTLGQQELYLEAESAEIRNEWLKVLERVAIRPASRISIDQQIVHHMRDDDDDNDNNHVGGNGRGRRRRAYSTGFRHSANSSDNNNNSNNNNSGSSVAEDDGDDFYDDDSDDYPDEDEEKLYSDHAGHLSSRQLEQARMLMGTSSSSSSAAPPTNNKQQFHRSIASALAAAHGVDRNVLSEQENAVSNKENLSYYPSRAQEAAELEDSFVRVFEGYLKDRSNPHRLRSSRRYAVLFKSQKLGGQAEFRVYKSRKQARNDWHKPYYKVRLTHDSIINSGLLTQQLAWELKAECEQVDQNKEQHCFHLLDLDPIEAPLLNQHLEDKLDSNQLDDDNSGPNSPYSSSSKKVRRYNAQRYHTYSNNKNSIGAEDEYQEERRELARRLFATPNDNSSATSNNSNHDTQNSNYDDRNNYGNAADSKDDTNFFSSSSSSSPSSSQSPTWGYADEDIFWNDSALLSTKLEETQVTQRPEPDAQKKLRPFVLMECESLDHRDEWMSVISDTINACTRYSNLKRDQCASALTRKLCCLGYYTDVAQEASSRIVADAKLTLDGRLIVDGGATQAAIRWLNAFEEEWRSDHPLPDEFDNSSHRAYGTSRQRKLSLSQRWRRESLHLRQGSLKEGQAQKKKTGNAALVKDWHERYLMVLKREIRYFHKPTDKAAKGIIEYNQSTWIDLIDDEQSLEEDPDGASGRQYKLAIIHRQPPEMNKKQKKEQKEKLVQKLLYSNNQAHTNPVMDISIDDLRAGRIVTWVFGFPSKNLRNEWVFAIVAALHECFGSKPMLGDPYISMRSLKAERKRRQEEERKRKEKEKRKRENGGIDPDNMKDPFQNVADLEAGLLDQFDSEHMKKRNFLNWVKHKHKVASVFYVGERDGLPRFGRFALLLFDVVSNVVLSFGFMHDTTMNAVQQVALIIFLLVIIGIIMRIVLINFGYAYKKYWKQVAAVTTISFLYLSLCAILTYLFVTQMGASKSQYAGIKLSVSAVLSWIGEFFFWWFAYSCLRECCPCIRLDDAFYAEDDIKAAQGRIDTAANFAEEWEKKQEQERQQAAKRYLLRKKERQNMRIN